MEPRFIQGIQDLLDTFVSRNCLQLQQAVTCCANSIEAGRGIHLFGAGHSALPCMEAFPRIGSFIGFHQLTEPSLGFNGFVTGKGGQRQMSFLEQTSGFAAVIFENYRFSSDDTLIVFSHSGINALPVEMAEMAHLLGMQTIAVVSLAHAKSQSSKAPSGKRLDEVASYVIDTCVPAHDAIVDIGDGEKSGGASTVMSMIVMNTIVSETAALLKKRDVPVMVYPSHNVSQHVDEVLEREKSIFDAYKTFRAKF
ncbi:sugar isomerase domain-containing protein [Sediminispirochaeta bajacaliforniensis]|uniref:sugar isomerase domain-containing protein n=1 Tax=Sediminispirochaeta bajacaliforniensis TaxID=148 RepID=UPI00037E9295|nr:sugar isomerase domain-containing protein [Sediminispirochaeta bajacaliforniensis]